MIEFVAYLAAVMVAGFAGWTIGRSSASEPRLREKEAALIVMSHLLDQASEGDYEAIGALPAVSKIVGMD